MSKHTILLWSILIALTGCKDTIAGANSAGHLNASGNKEDTVLVSWNYGPPPEPYHTKAELEVLAEYGATVQWVGGCTVTDSFVTAVKAHNEAVNAALERRYGSGIAKMISGKIAERIVMQKAIEKIFNRQSFMQRVAATLAKSSRSFFYNWKPSGKESVFIVDAYLVTPDIAGPVKNFWHQFLVDTSNRTDVMVRGSDSTWSECTKLSVE